MTALNQKMWRDLWHMRAQALAIALVIMCGVAVYMMFISTLDSLHLTRATYYENNRFADVFASLKRAPEGLRQRIAAIPGVESAETRVVANINLDIIDFPEPATGLLVSVPDDGTQHLNALYLRQGRFVDPGRDDEVIISEAFAEAHGFKPGDTLFAIINGHRRALTIVGSALSPEYIHQLRPGGMFPDYKRFAVFWMSRNALGQAYDMDGAFNNVVLRLLSGTNVSDVIDRLDDLLEPYGGYGAIERADQRSNRFLAEEFLQLQNLANIFPVIFLGIAAFMLNVVIGRMVTLQREQVAALKAFGYDNRAVVWHFLKLVLIIVFFGVVSGIILGVYLGNKLAAIYTLFFRLPYLAFVIEPGVIIEATFISALAATLGTVFAVRRAAVLKPAEAMRPEPPTIYRKTILEHIGLQRFFSQPTRMILRHIERRPVKSLLTVFGIALACGLVMTGRFQPDTVSYMIDVQYNIAHREDISITFNEPTAKKAQYELQGLHGVEHVEVFRAVPVRLRFQHRSYRTGITGVEPGGDIQRLLDADLQPIRLPASGVVLTDYLGTLLGVRPGDRITVEILEGDMAIREVTVAGLVKEYLGVSAYMELGALNRLLHEGPTISGAYLAVDSKMQTALYGTLKKMPQVAGIAVREQEIRNYNKTMRETMLFYSYVGSVFSIIIAFGIIYNNARITLTERGRELASLRVLGMTRAEISYILLGELGILTLLAMPLGIIIGEWLCMMIVINAQTDLFRVPVILELDTYAFAVTIVLVSAIASGLLVRRRLDELDLIAVLKTKE